MKKERKINERKEVLWRILIAVVSGIVLYLWGYAVAILAIINLVYTLIFGKRIKELADFSEIWVTQFYYFARYISFVSNERPFPFVEMKKNLGKFE